MKKHHIVLFIILVNLLIFTTYMFVWLGSEEYSETTFLSIILTMSYVIPVSLIALFILLNKGFTSKKKVIWITYVILTYFIGCIHYYARYRNEMTRTTHEVDKKMKEGPDSLSEFDSGSNR